MDSEFWHPSRSAVVGLQDADRLAVLEVRGKIDVQTAPGGIGNHLVHVDLGRVTECPFGPSAERTSRLSRSARTASIGHPSSTRIAIAIIWVTT
jgi:hypothetical protein